MYRPGRGIPSRLAKGPGSGLAPRDGAGPLPLHLELQPRRLRRRGLLVRKIHARRGYRWVHPVHEVLEWVGEGEPGPFVRVEGVQLDHHPDPNKSRAQYLELLELSVREAPQNDRNLHYLGREYLFRRRWEDCIRTLKAHLALPSATWRDERAASMRYLGCAYE